MTKQLLGIEYDRAVISENLTVKSAKEVSDFLECPITLSEYLPDNHVTLLNGDRFVATINLDTDYV